MSCCYLSCAPSCLPSCSVPTCIQPVSCSPSSCYPVGSLGSLSSCCSPCGGLSYGSSGGLSYGGAASAGSLGILRGANVSCISQIPPSEIVIQPPSSAIVLPGPILSASSEPVRVGGYSACSGGGSISRGAVGISAGSGHMGTIGVGHFFTRRRISIADL